MRLAAVWVALGCRSPVTERVVTTIDDDVARLEAFVERGRLDVTGAPAGPAGQGALTVTADLVGADPPTVEVVLDALRVDAPATRRSTTALGIAGRPGLAVVAEVPGGTVTLDGVTGDHEVVAERVEVVGGSGDRRLTATAGGLTIDGDPEPGDVWVLDVTGDLWLGLPDGVEVRLDAVLSEGARAEITGPRFDELWSTDDYVRARSGSGAVDVRVDVRAGTLFLFEVPRP